MKSQQGFVTIATTSKINHGFELGAVVEFQSSTIRRVTQSTMASAFASLASAIDRQLYARALMQGLIHGEPCFASDWRKGLKIPGILVTDARSLYDHLHKTGSIPRERQTLLDLLAARELVEDGICTVRWVSTLHMIADILTKDMKVPAVAERFLNTGELSLVPTEEEAIVESHRQKLRQGQRQRKRDKKNEHKEHKTQIADSGQ